MREAANKVDIDAVEADLPAETNKVGCLLHSLDASDGFLYLWREILDAEGNSVETEFAQDVEMFLRSNSYIYLNGSFGIGGNAKSFCHVNE